jgi:hypothetical protein
MELGCIDINNEINIICSINQMDKCYEKYCISDKICNPLSGRCVLKKGKIGLQVKSMNKKSPPKYNNRPDMGKCDHYKINDCLEYDKYCNPKSGRCVGKNLKIGKGLNSLYVEWNDYIKSVKDELRYIEEEEEVKEEEEEVKEEEEEEEEEEEDEELTDVYKDFSNMRVSGGLISPSQYLKESMEQPINYISGLLGFTVQYSAKYNKIIYIMGEQHNKDKICDSNLRNAVNAYDMFFKLLNSTSNLIDVFIEEDFDPSDIKSMRFWVTEYYYKVNNNNANGFMGEVANHLHKHACFTGKYKGCLQYKNHVRFHLSDIRGTTIHYKFMEYINTLYSLSRIDIDIYTDKERRDTKNKLLDKLVRIAETGIVDNVRNIKQALKQALEDFKINKQLYNIPDEYVDVKNLLNNQLETFINAKVSGLLYSNVKKYIKRVRDNDPTVYLEIRYLLTYKLGENQEVPLPVYLMDMFLFSRIFRRFEQVKGRISNEPTNIIIYTGNVHSDNYRYMLEKLGFNYIIKSKPLPMSESCVNIEGFKYQWIKADPYIAF